MMKNLKWLVLSILVIILDQITKLYIIDTMALYDVIPVAEFFNIVRVHNHGAAFSFLADAGGWQRLFFSVIAIGVSVAMVVWLYKMPAGKRLLPIAIALVVGGAIGNLIDRLAYGYVVDFLDAYYGSYHWPAFNVADISISIGAFLLFVDAIFFADEKQEAIS